MKTPLVYLLAALAASAPVTSAQAPRTTQDTTLLPSPATPSLSGTELPETVLARVRAADDERIAATRAADRARLSAIYSDQLHYGHSNGKVDTKASQIEGIVSGGNTYESFDYKERTFLPAGPGVVLMKGRVLMHLKTRTGEKMTNDLNYLAVWREENGRWRFLAWQSCRNPPPAAK